MPATVALAFFPRRRMRATRHRLAFDPTASGLIVTPLDGPFALRPVRFTGAVDTHDACLLLPEVPVRGSAFGASVDRHRIRLRIGHDGALHAETRAATAGVSLFVPVAGTARIWGRRERAVERRAPSCAPEVNPPVRKLHALRPGSTPGSVRC